MTKKLEKYLDRTYIGFVKEVIDAKYAGRLRVWIPEFHSLEDDENGWIICTYCSPFAGATNWRTNSQNNYDEFSSTQTAYGFWAVPPDINNEVVVMFPGGDVAKAIWIGCLFNEYMLHEVPGIAASDKNKQLTSDVPNSKKPIPVAEYNKWDTTQDTSDPLNPTRPWHETRTMGIGKQGLLGDNIRGTTTSSAMRETPSHVFGISTPGPVDEKASKKRGGVSRKGGHTFVMDDGDKDGNDEYIGFRTRSGAYIRIDESNGLIYMINRDGTSWVQMDADGNVDIFGAKSISMRAQEDVNIRADRDVNIEAGRNINYKATADTVEGEDGKDRKIVGEGAGEGGDIFIQAIRNLHFTVGKDAYFTVEDGNYDIDIKVGNKTEHIGGDNDSRIDGKSQKTVKGSYGIRSLNYHLSNKGDIDNKGIISSAKDHYAPDFHTPSHGLNDHQHFYFMPKHPAGLVDTQKDGGGGGKNRASGPVAKKAVPADKIEKVKKTNVLATFGKGEATVIKLGNQKVPAEQGGKSAEIPNFWDRDIESIETIVKRFMTYEPCPDHINKGKE